MSYGREHERELGACCDQLRHLLGAAIRPRLVHPERTRVEQACLDAESPRCIARTRRVTNPPAQHIATQPKHGPSDESGTFKVVALPGSGPVFGKRWLRST
eukprot:825746-Rhodomonas_salina.3